MCGGTLESEDISGRSFLKLSRAGIRFQVGVRFGFTELGCGMFYVNEGPQKDRITECISFD